MSKKLFLLISFVLVLGLASNAFGEDRWSNDAYYEQWIDWHDANSDGTWLGNVPSNAEVAHVDGWGMWVEIDKPGATAGELHVGCWYSMWWDGRVLLNIYSGADLVVDAGNLDPDTDVVSSGNFMVGIQPYMDWGNPDWGNHGWGVVTMSGGNVLVEGDLIVGVDGVGYFYLNGGTIQAEGFSMGTPRNSTAEEDPDRVVDYDFDWRDNIMDIAGGKLILAGDISSLDPRVVPYGSRGYLNYAYEADVAGYTSITAIPDFNIAYGPIPADGAADVPVDSNLVWWPGDNAQDVNGHEVYLGTSFAEVNNADPNTAGIYRGSLDVSSYPDPCDANVTIYTYDPGPLDWAETYYWRIDEVNETNTTWKGRVWSFTTPTPSAKDPSPANGADNVSLLTGLSWTSGIQAVSHEVYLSTDFDEVNDRSISPVIESANSHDPGPLEFDTTYYWAIDEVNLAADVNTWFGNLWQFITAPYLIVDDFDTYANDLALQNVWEDYWTNGWGAEVFVNVDANFVIDGNSMQYDYDNTTRVGGKYRSRADADTVDLPVGLDWTVSGAKALRLAFYGELTNSTTVNDKMYIALDDGTTVHSSYYPDVNDINEESWHEWNIDLVEDFNIAGGINLANVSRITIGFGTYLGSGTAGGTGTVYFDDIRLYPRRCRPELVAHDLDGNCIADIWDLWLIGQDWLVYDYTVDAEPAPDTAAGGLLAWYKFNETSGAIAYDSSDNGYNAPVNVDFGWDSTGGFDGNSCLYTATGGIYVDVPNEVLYDRLPMTELTISMWVKPESLSHTDWYCMFGGGSDAVISDWWLISAMNLNYISTEPGYYVSFYGPSHYGWMEGIEYLDPNTSGSEGWHHYAFCKNSDQSLMSIYRDGLLVLEEDWPDTPIRPLDPNNHEFWIGAIPTPWGWGDWLGWIDEVRIYDHSLPHSQIVDLAGLSSVYMPIVSNANPYDAEAINSKKVNFNDFAIMADGWLLEEQLWP